MNMIQKLLKIEETTYTTNLSQNTIIEMINSLFEKKNMGISGEVLKKNIFTAHDKMNVIGWNMPNTKRKAAYLRGKISKGQNNQTLINLEVNPNTILPLFAIVSIFIGTVISLFARFNYSENQFIFIIGLVFIAFGIIYYPLSILLKNRLRNKFVKFLKLKET